MIIYANGDSFTAGQGIYDYLMFPDDYPKNNRMGDTYDNKLSSNWNEKRHQLIQKHNCLEELSENNRKRAYPAHFGKLLGATKVINGATPGSSIFGIYYRTVYDITEIIKKGQKIDLILIGLTSPERLYYFNKEPNSSHASWIHNVTPKLNARRKTKHSKYFEEYWTSHADDEIFVNFLYQCLAIKTFVKSATGKNPMFLNTSTSFWKSREVMYENNLPMLNHIWEVLNFDIIAGQKPFYHIGRENLITACGHYEEKSHFQYAKYIEELLLTNEQDVL